MLEKQQDDINDAITRFIKVPWISEKAEKLIKLNYGDITLEEIDRICAYAANSHIWSYDNHTVSFKETVESLRIEYPYLTDEALLKVTKIAAHFWK